jgi:hypothetical protein
MIAACESKRIPATVEWRGHAFQEVRTLADLPPVIQAGLGVERPGLDGVADRGRPFNVTDFVDGNLPTRRLLAGRDGETWLVALEQGGRGYRVVVFLFSPLEATPRPKWVLLERPRTLREVVQQVSQKEQMNAPVIAQAAGQEPARHHRDSSPNGSALSGRRSRTAPTAC